MVPKTYKNYPFTKADLQEVYDLIKNPQNWCKGAGARDRYGSPCGVHDPEAASWCLDGAFIRCGLNHCQSERELGLFHTTRFNDKSSHVEVLGILQAAINRAPDRGGQGDEDE